MSIDAGKLLLHYRLIEQIGEGGMGVVWKAMDTTLDREVAIKVLPAGMVKDVERLARFEREAKLLASLNHPNIAGVYGLHEAEGVRFLAMELVSGEDLAVRLERGPIPTGQVLDIARKVAGAVEAAHDQGVIHRDLKPANVLLTADGQVKVLDFGLAKALDPPGAAGDSSASPTITSLGTVAGTILGTAAYMSPEQARGHDADRRADVWSFGALVFEMLSNTRPFEGSTNSDTLAAVLRAEPDWERLRDDTPPLVRRLLRRCLTKEARSRTQSIAEARARIEDAIADPDDLGSGITAPVASIDAGAAPDSRSWVVVLAAGCGAGRRCPVRSHAGRGQRFLRQLQPGGRHFAGFPDHRLHLRGRQLQFALVAFPGPHGAPAGPGCRRGALPGVLP
jgi:serine/threonine protein kinase